MRALVIKSTALGSHTLWVAETSSGVRWTAASLESLVKKMAPADATYDADDYLEAVFRQIPDSGSSQIQEGVQS